MTKTQRKAAAPARQGRQSRRQARAAKSPGIIAGTRREIPPYVLVNDEGLEIVEAAAEDILQEIGIEFRGDQDALNLWRNAGADVQGERVRFDKGMVRQIATATAPTDFVQHARNPARSVQVGGSNVVFAPAYGMPFVRDLDNGRRYGSIGDFEKIIKITYMSPWLHHSGGTVCEPVDLPVNKRHLDMVYAHLRWSDKPFMGSVTAPERADDSIDMARITFGEDFVDRNCVIMGNINMNSPLVYDQAMSGSLRAYARANQCPVVVPFVLGGATAPVTMAAAVAQAYAEVLVGCALGQLVRPGSPVVFGNFVTSVDLRSGAPTFGTPEPVLGSYVAGQLARRIGLPK
jgi:trimethylamine--corrinoid protein Co-methyltransferase